MRVYKGQIPRSIMYKKYCEKVDNPVPYKQFSKIISLWGKEVVKNLVLGKTIELYSGFKTMAVIKKKGRRVIDFKELRENKKFALLNNSHSDYYTAYVYWAKNKVRAKTKGWSFNTSKYFKQEIYKVMKDKKGHTNFMQKAWFTTSANKQYKLRTKAHQL